VDNKPPSPNNITLHAFALNLKTPLWFNIVCCFCNHRAVGWNEPKWRYNYSQ